MTLPIPRHAAVFVLAIVGALVLSAPSDARSARKDAGSETSAVQALSLIPQPANVQLRAGAFAMTPHTPVVAEGEAVAAADYFKTLLATSQRAASADAPRTAAVRARSATHAPAIVFALDPARASGNPESYTLDVSPDAIRVAAGDPRGLFYGGITLWQLSTSDAARGGRIPAVHIDDAPRFAWRGLMLDSARHFQSVGDIERLLDAMAVHKLNVFHWHLTDDQGWRIEIKRYPKLTSVGGCRIPAGDAGIGADGKPASYCGYYTQDQIRAVVRYAAERHITIVPEIDVPGHATAAIAAYPKLGVSGKPLAVSNEWGVNRNLFNVEDDTLRFLENVLGEVVTLFPGEYVHIGGDEAVKDQWQASARVQARMRKLGAKDEMAMQGLVVARLEKYLAAHKRRLIGWDEILEGELPVSATVMSWRGIDGGLEAARKGHDVVMSPSSVLYLDYLQTDLPDEPPGRPALNDLRKAYAFESVPAALDATQRHHVLGLQANTWTEHMRSFARVEHALFPRIAAVAETGWSPAAAKNYDAFLARLPAQLRRYRALGIGYARTPFEVRMQADAGRKPGTVAVTLSNPAGYRDLRYTTDGRAPTAKSRAYAAPLTLKLPTTLTMAAFVDGQPLAEPQTRVFDAASQRTRRGEDLAMCTNALMLRLEDDGPRDGDRAIFNVDIFNPCWEWNRAALDGIVALRVRAGRIPYFFQLAHDESHRTFKPATTAHGELVVRAGCDGATLATQPLPAQPDADGFVDLRVSLPAHAGTQDLCVYFTGDTRPTMWVLDRATLVPRDGAR